MIGVDNKLIKRNVELVIIDSGLSFGDRAEIIQKTFQSISWINKSLWYMIFSLWIKTDYYFVFFHLNSNTLYRSRQRFMFRSTDLKGTISLSNKNSYYHVLLLHLIRTSTNFWIINIQSKRYRYRPYLRKLI